MHSQASRQTTLLIPTYNRPNFVRRLLFFLERLQCNCLIKIYDSSEREVRPQTEAVASEYSSGLTVEYIHVELGVFEKFALALDQTDTPFVVFCADDDFVGPGAVSAAADFLTEHPDHSCAGGQLLKIRTSGDSPKVIDTLCRTYDVCHPSPLTRSRLNAEHWFSTFYNLHRTELFRENLRFVTSNSDFKLARIYPEYLIDQLSVLTGKVKSLPMLFSIRQMHSNCYGRLPLVEDLRNNHFHYRRFQKALASQLVRFAGVGTEEAIMLVDKQFSHMLRPKFKRPPLARIRRELTRTVRSLVDRLIGDGSLEGKPLSPHHPIRKDLAWQLAHGLIERFPNGMSSADTVLSNTLEQASAGDKLLKKSA